MDAGAFWKRESKKGMKYLSGVIYVCVMPINVALFPNERKEKENQPDFRAVYSEPMDKTESKNDDFFDDLGPEPQGEGEEVDIEEVPLG